MAVDPNENNIFPPEVLAAIVRDAEEDADAVADFLELLGFSTPDPEKRPCRLPAVLLLGLGAAMRLLSWELQGFEFDPSMGLPSAYDAIGDVFRRTAEAKSDASDVVIMTLWVKVLQIKCQHFALEGVSFLGADVALGDVEEESLLDALAQLCWAHRKQGEESE